MKYLTLFIIVIAGCSNSKSPPIEYMDRQGHLSLARYDSVEYYKTLEKNFAHRNSFISILYYNDREYTEILYQVKKDSSYYLIKDKGQKKTVLHNNFEKYINHQILCKNKKIYANNLETTTTIIVFCDRVYFKHALNRSFD